LSAVIVDRTESKQAEEELHQKEVSLREAQTALAHISRVTTMGELAASIAHEINQPLAAVVNNASACVRWLTAHNLEEARQSAALVIAEGHRAAEIIDRIRPWLRRRRHRKTGWTSTKRSVKSLQWRVAKCDGIAFHYKHSSQMTYHSYWEIKSNCNR